MKPDPRLLVAETLMRDLRGRPEIDDVWLRGSLAAGTADALSDLDIGLRSDTSTNAALGALAVQCVRDRGGIDFIDWTWSALPDESILTVFSPVLPVPWKVDFELHVRPGRRVLPGVRPPGNDPDHILKLWMAHAVTVARGRTVATPVIRKLLARAGATCETDDPREALHATLAAIEQRSGPHRAPFIESCRRFLHDAVR
jgi:hypothetical protein